MTTPKIKIAISHRQQLFRKSLITLLQTAGEIEIRGDHASGQELLHALKEKPADLVLVSSSMPVPGSCTILQLLQQRFPSTKIIVLGSEANTVLPSDFIQLGANGFLGDNCSASTLFQAIREVNKGGYFLDDDSSLLLLDSILKSRNKKSSGISVELSSREIQVLEQICNGSTNKAIALNLHLSVSTIDFYRTKLYQKTNCNSAVELLKYALKQGLVTLG